jgi:hypothetical protein
VGLVSGYYVFCDTVLKTIPGLISQVLAAEDPKLIVGVDISQAMVDHYNKTVSDHDVSFEEMKAICVTELRENEKQLEGITFDVIVVSRSCFNMGTNKMKVASR